MAVWNYQIQIRPRCRIWYYVWIQFRQDFYKRMSKFSKWRVVKLIACVIFHVFYYKLYQKHPSTFELELIFHFTTAFIEINW